MGKNLFLPVAFMVIGMSMIVPQVHSQSTANKAVLLNAVENFVWDIPGKSRVFITAITGDNDLNPRYIQSVIISNISESILVLTEKRRALDIAIQDDYLNGVYEYGNDVRIGNISGANILVTGGVSGNGDSRRMVFKVLDVESAQILAESCVPFTQNKAGLVNNIETLSKKIHDSLSRIIRGGSSITIINNAGTNSNADFLLDMIENNLVKASGYKIVTREKLDLLRKELEFQATAYVSEKTTVEIGKFISAEYIVAINVVNSKIQITVLDTSNGNQIMLETR